MILDRGSHGLFNPEGVTRLCHPFGIVVSDMFDRYNHGIPSGFCLRYVFSHQEKRRASRVPMFSISNKPTMNKTPFRVTLTLWLVLLLTAWNALRLWTALAWQNVLNEFSSQPTSTITAVSGAFWIVAGIILLWSIWQKKAWAAKLLLGTAAGYSVWYWSEILIWQNLHPNWLFNLIVNLVLMIFILFTTKSLMRETHERKNKNPTTE